MLSEEFRSKEARRVAVDRVMVQARLKVDLYEKVKKAAAAADIPIAQFIRLVCLRAVEQGVNLN
jgi:hypothetical protein